MEVYRAEQTAASSVLIAVCGRYISEKNTREDKTFMQKKKKKSGHVSARSTSQVHYWHSEGLEYLS